MKEDLIERLRQYTDFDNKENQNMPTGLKLMEEAISALESMRAWAKCSERLPDKAGSYFAYGPIYEPGLYETTLAFFNSSKEWCDQVGYFLEGITHWMPLPAPPKVEEAQCPKS